MGAKDAYRWVFYFDTVPNMPGLAENAIPYSLRDPAVNTNSSMAHLSPGYRNRYPTNFLLASSLVQH